ncbi:MAG: PLP-dependent aminotransferase family protein [Sphaerobacteraceae bacterium]|nr:MAG: PLP-dependent aminotransferase family protein [Sphaerobacteraceae bacterium]
MLVELDRESDLPLYLQISNQIRERIHTGDLAVGSKLPPERRLAAMLGVNRTTIVTAYRELAADGLVEGHVGRGTVVADPDPDTGQSSNHQQIPWSQLFTSTTEVMNDPLLRDTTMISSRPDVISLATGIPSPELYPIELIRGLLDEALHTDGQALLQHCPTEGYWPLRSSLGDWMAGDGKPVDPENVLVVAGSQQGLYLLARTLLDPDDLVVIESPTYLGALQVFRAAGARLLPIPVDSNGMRVGLLEDLLARRRPKLIYTLPSFQNPSGGTMNLDRRRRLLDLAERYRIPIIEDDPYSVLRYEGPALPTLHAMDQRGIVIHLSTFSKILFPGFRIGWIAGPQPILKRLALMKQIVDLDTNPLAQWAVWALLDRGHLREHVEELQSIYPYRRDLMLEALQRHCTGLLQWNRPHGGFYIWARLTDGLRARDLLPEAARFGVSVAPGESFHVDDEGESTLRLNFTLPAAEEIDEGIRRLAGAIESLRSLRGTDDRKAREAVTPIV